MANRRKLAAAAEFDRILAVQSWILRRLGCDVFDLNYRFSPATWVIVFLASFYMVISAYDLYRFRNDVFNFAFSLVTLSYGVIGCTRIVLFLRNSRTYAQIVVEARRTYEQVSNEREQEVQERYTRMLKRCVTFYSVSFIGGCIMGGFFPLAVYWWTGLKVLPFGVILPFTDPDTIEGYQLNYLYQVSCIVWTPPGLTATQNVYFALVFNLCIQYDVLKLKLEDLDKLIRDGAEYDTIHEKLVEIINWQRHLVDFIAEIDRNFTVQTFVEISSVAMQMVIVLFVLHIDVWLPGYMVIFVASFQLFVLCILGAMIEFKSDIFTEQIYDIAWHRMRTPEQKMVQFMLAKAQYTMQLTYGGMLPLNMNLFVTIYKKTYSVFMMLQNM
ncbi:odorant receptor [Culex quinquefasciatus]|uniref:Odorant receptor n=1 Tax=Culex quinquefasciatus TaxID=7176 RepID=B0XIB4_CULQU|nr:odorant receptor [Culex quinquefasciatus]|eukprot:XP_001869386.1 odorant receptor [Culex quinquefasciatus]